jgi:hypothetical protein
MATVDLYIDAGQCKAVAGPSDSSIVALPRFSQGDTLAMRIWLLAPTATDRLATPFTYIPTTGLTLQVALGAKVGNSTTYYTQQFSWTASPEPENPYWSGALPINTAEITSLIGSAASALAWFEIKYVSGGLPTTVLCEQITIHAGVIKSGGVTVPNPLTPLSAEAANATFLTRTIEGQITLRNAATGKEILLYVDDDGVFHADAAN